MATVLLKDCDFTHFAVPLAILTAVFLDKVNGRFGGTLSCHVQGRRTSQRSEACGQHGVVVRNAELIITSAASTSNPASRKEFSMPA